MSQPVSLASLFEAAERAAAAGDFAAAARSLADAARAQQETLGPDHPDLANTLNNLAVAHERSGQLDDAEREYRRAHAIAARVLPADDPLVATSALNLREFCEANGRPLDLPALRLAAAADDDAATVARPRPATTAPPASPVEPLAITFAAEPRSGTPAGRSPAAATEPRRPLPPPPAPAAPRMAAPEPARSAAAPAAPTSGAAPRARVPIAVWIAIGAIVGLLLWLFAGRGPAAPPADAPTPPAGAPPAGTPAPSADGPAPPAAAVPVPPPAAPSSATAAPAPAAVPAPSGPPAETGPRAADPSPAASASAGGITVGEAQLCTTLSPTYRCTPAGATVRPGSLVFFTRLIASSNTSVVHRWYRGDQVRQSVRLEVPARRQGYRTFSRTTVTASDGEWRVELRTRDGQLLHTERFTVR